MLQKCLCRTSILPDTARLPQFNKKPSPSAVLLTSAMNRSPNSTDQWQPCTPGTLAQLAGKDRRRRRRRTMLEIGSAVVISGVLLATAIFGIESLRPTEPNFGGITCSVVRAHAAEFMSGQIDPVLAEQMRLHLAQCPECQALWRQMSTPASTEVSQLNARHSGNGCTCDRCRHHHQIALQFDRASLAASDGLVAIAAR